MLSSELRYTYCWRGLGREVAEEAAVVCRVFLLAQARAEVQQADQLALAQQRNGDLHASFPERLDSRRVKGELVDFDDVVDCLKVPDDRVVGRDIDGFDNRVLRYDVLNSIDGRVGPPIAANQRLPHRLYFCCHRHGVHILPGKRPKNVTGSNPGVILLESLSAILVAATTRCLQAGRYRSRILREFPPAARDRLRPEQSC